MSNDGCRVTVGMPVYNGAAYLAEAITSILEQSFRELRLVISDNASTDETEAICRDFVKHDDRVQYFRHSVNIGGTANFDWVMRNGRNEFFKWAAHDDVCRPDLIQRCVEVLDSDPSVVLAYGQTVDIDSQGSKLRIRDDGLGLDADDPYERFRRLISQGHGATMLYGVHRWSILAQSLPQGSFFGSDRPLLGELALRGRLVEVPEPLFLRRQHEDRSVRGHKLSYGVPEWFKPGSTSELAAPVWRRLLAYVRVVLRVPNGPGNRVRCLTLMARWAVDMRSHLAFEVRLGSRLLFTRLATRARGLLARLSRAGERSTRRLRGRFRDYHPIPAYAENSQAYWDNRHGKAGASLEGVGCAGLGAEGNQADYEEKWQRLEELLSASGIQGGDRIVDAGCGIGYFCRRMASSGLRVDGVDFSHEALRIAREASPKEVTYHSSSLDGFSLDFQARAVVCVDVLFHVVDDDLWSASVRNLARHVSDDGVLVIQEELTSSDGSSERGDRCPSHVRRRTLADYERVLTDWTLTSHVRYRLPKQGSDKDLICFTRL